MDTNEFREFGKAAVEYIAHYYETIDQRQVLPSVKPGYLRPLVPDKIPTEPESWSVVLKDMDRVVMPGMTHWRSPHFHAYFPSGGSFPSMIGEMMCAALGVIGFSWMSNPACTELELVMMDWLAQAMDLPQNFLNLPESKGGGVFQSTASESCLLALLVSKERVVKRIQLTKPEMTSQEIKSKLVCYSSEHANSSVEKAANIASVPIHLLSADKQGRLRGLELKAAMEADIKKGLIPCCVCCTFGTTGNCAFDAIEEIGPICKATKVWLHIDAAYAGAALVCPELRHLMKGIEFADSFVVNLHKWLLVNFDCAAMWFMDRGEMEECFEVERIYLKHQHSHNAPDLRKFQIPLGRKFRALKVWFTFRIYGLSGIQSYIRRQIHYAEEFEKLVLKNPLYEVVVPKVLGLTCFRLKGSNRVTQLLVQELSKRKNIYVIPATLNGVLYIRFVVCNALAKMEDLLWAWQEIQIALQYIMENKEEPLGLTSTDISVISGCTEFTIVQGPKRFKSKKKFVSNFLPVK